LELTSSSVSEDTRRLEEWFDAASARLLDEFERRLEKRLQRLEALTQAMTTLVGDPLDALAQNLRDLSVLPPTGAEDTRTDVAVAINALIREAKAREATLQALLAKVDELTEVIVG